MLAGRKTDGAIVNEASGVKTGAGEKVLPQAILPTSVIFNSCLKPRECINMGYCTACAPAFTGKLVGRSNTHYMQMCCATKQQRTGRKQCGKRSLSNAEAVIRTPGRTEGASERAASRVGSLITAQRASVVIARTPQTV